VAYYPYALATFSPSIENAPSGLINNIGDLPGIIKLTYDINFAINLSKVELLDLENNSLGELNFEGIEK